MDVPQARDHERPGQIFDGRITFRRLARPDLDDPAAVDAQPGLVGDGILSGVHQT